MNGNGGREHLRGGHSMEARLQAGDPEAERAFHSRHAPFVRSQLVRLLGGHDSAEDVTQEVFASVFAWIRRNGMPETFRPWLLKVTRNHAIRHLEGAPRATPHEPEAVERLLDAGDRLEPDPHEVLLASQGTAQITAPLPREQRRAIALRYDMDLDWQRAASILGISPEAARRLHQRGIDSLRRHLQPPDGENGRREDHPALRIWSGSRVIQARKQAACWTL